MTVPAASRPVGSRRAATSRPRVISDRVVYRGDGVGAVHETRLRFGRGVVRTWSYLIKRPFVMIVALVGRRVVLVRQHRYPQPPAWELVKGNIERGESPMAAARRELREETGWHGGRWQRLGQVMPAPGYFNQPGFVFLARDLQPGNSLPESNGEVLGLRRSSRSEVNRFIDRGLIYDNTTLAGLLLARKYFPL